MNEGRNIIHITVITILLSCLLTSTYAQEEKPQKVEFNKNAIYGNVGSAGYYFTATAYYERMIKQQMWNRNIASFVKLGYGAETHFGGGGMYLLAQYGLLFGAKKHHLEIGLGIHNFFKGDLKEDPFLSPINGTIGWRFQKPEGKFIFRMGASWPDAAYVGIGFSF